MKVHKFLMNLKRSLHFKHFFCFSFFSKIVIYYFMFYMTAQCNTWPLRALIYFCFQQWQLWRIQSQLEIQKASPKLLNKEFRLKKSYAVLLYDMVRKQWMNTNFVDYSFTLRMILYHCLEVFFVWYHETHHRLDQHLLLILKSFKQRV